MTDDLLRRYFPDAAERYFPPMKIGGTPASADEGAALILAGIKTATSSASWHYSDGRIPFVGALSVLLDGADRPCAVVETIRLVPMPFNRVDADFARAYGEGDRTLAGWRREMGAWYRAEAARHGVDFDDSSMILCEWIRVARRLDG